MGGKAEAKTGAGAASVPRVLFLPCRAGCLAQRKSSVNVREMDEFVSRSTLPGVTVHWW